MRSRRVIVTGAPFNQGQPHKGVAQAPELLRERGLIERLEKGGVRVADSGDVVLDEHGASESCRRIAEHIGRSADSLAMQLVLGGDHAIGLATVTATLRRHPSAGVIWVDAHGDMNTPANTPSGNFHGMPLGLLLDEFTEEDERGFEWVDVRLDPRRLVVIGARSLDEGEIELIERRGILVFTMDDVRALGVAEVLRRTQVHLDRAGTGPIHLSLDIDALDPSAAPATGTPVDTGLTLHEGLQICRFFSRSRRLAAMDLVEVNPDLGETYADVATTADAALQLIRAAVTPSRRQAIGMIPRRLSREFFRASIRATRAFRGLGGIPRKGTPA